MAEIDNRVPKDVKNYKFVSHTGKEYLIAICGITGWVDKVKNGDREEVVVSSGGPGDLMTVWTMIKEILTLELTEEEQEEVYSAKKKLKDILYK